MVAFRADRVALQPASGSAGGNAFPGLIETVAFLGTCFDYTITAGPLQVQAEGPVDHPVARGEAVDVAIAREHCHAFTGPRTCRNAVSPLPRGVGSGRRTSAPTPPTD